MDLGPGNTLIPGTVIATFYHGHYPSWPHGNHAAFFLRVSERDSTGRVSEIVIMDQWKGDRYRPFVASRRLRVRVKTLPDGKPDMSNDLSFFYVVE